MGNDIKNEFRELMEKLNYEEGAPIFGKAKVKDKKGSHLLEVWPYDVDGNITNKKIRCFDVDRWIINEPARGEYYVRGELVIDNTRGAIAFKANHFYETWDSFKTDLRNAVKNRIGRKWLNEDFEYDLECNTFENELCYSTWCANKISAKVEEKCKGEISKTETELQRIKESIEEETETLDKIKKGIVDNKPLYDKYVEWGIIPSEVSTGEENKYPFKNFAQLIDDVKRYLWNKKGLFYERETIRCFLSAMRTQQLIILWGRPGTGKTSLPKAIAKALGAECTCIQVQSNWTDNQDLLGYYNPVDKYYVSTEFLDALLAANQNSEILHFVILDEMNLSCVEYYFSEMLNYFTRGKENHVLKLYSKRIEDYNKPVLEKDGFIPSSFKVPDNVIIVGTLNSDETTKSISPKVIDRSCLIELTGVEPPEDEPQSLEDELEGKYVSSSVFNKKGSVEETGDSAEFYGLNEVRKFIKGLKDKDSEGFSLSRRLDLYVDQWMAGNHDSHCEPEECIDDIVLTKVLPLFDSVPASSKNPGRIEKDIKELTCSKNKFKRMRELAKNEIDQKLKYWEK